MQEWVRQRQGYLALVRLAQAPRTELARRVGTDGDGLDAAHRKLRECILEEHNASDALRRTREFLASLTDDRTLMAETLMAANAEVRRHQELEFDSELMTWA